eukprot:6195063-Prymnesium_polylepis.2
MPEGAQEPLPAIMGTGKLIRNSVGGGEVALPWFSSTTSMLTTADTRDAAACASPCCSASEAVGCFSRPAPPPAFPLSSGLRPEVPPSALGSERETVTPVAGTKKLPPCDASAWKGRTAAIVPDVSANTTADLSEELLSTDAIKVLISKILSGSTGLATVPTAESKALAVAAGGGGNAGNEPEACIGGEESGGS